MKHFAGQVRMDHAPGRIGFMSTQRRANRWQRTGSTKRAAVLEISFPAPVVRSVRALANGGTAPPLYGAWLATNSLQLDHRFLQLAGQEIRRGSPPPGPGHHTKYSYPATHGSSLRHIPFPSGSTRLHLTLSQDPTGNCRRAERYDGKRDLYLQHAARNTACNS